MARARKGWIGRIQGLGEPLLFGWLGLTLIGIVWEQVAMLPPRPPTPAQVAADTPRARAQWRRVHAQLKERLFGEPELGAVWATREGRICGVVNTRPLGIDSVNPFFTVSGQPVFREDGEALYFHEWLNCLGNQWVVLNPGSADTGFCASAHGRSLPIADVLCKDPRRLGPPP